MRAETIGGAELVSRFLVYMVTMTTIMLLLTSVVTLVSS